MRLDWPEDFARRFGREVIAARHDVAQMALFSDAGLVDLLDTYPREKLGVWSFGAHREGLAEALRGRAGGLSGQELLDTVKRGHIWLNLRAANRELPSYDALCDAMFDAMSAAAGRRILKRDMGVLISSPNMRVHYHLDIPLVTLLQLRGEKRVWLYPARMPYALDKQIERVALREQDEEIDFRAAYDYAATVIDLKPGDAITWPQMAPHRIQNGDMINVSLSCEFMTLGGLIRANEAYANGVLRQRFGLRPRRSRAHGPRMLAKAGLARVFKAMYGHHPRADVSPVRFEIDPAAPGCIRRLDRPRLAA